MKNPIKALNLMVLLFAASFIFGSTANAQGCDCSSLEIRNVSPLANGNYKIKVRLCTGAGGGSWGAGQNTGDLGFIMEGAEFKKFPASIKSPQTGHTFTAVPHGKDSVQYSNGTQWYACFGNGECASDGPICQDFVFKTKGLPSKIYVVGMEGAGSAQLGCSGPEVEVNASAWAPADCSGWKVNLGKDKNPKASKKCVKLTATTFGGATYAWSTGETTEKIKVCPTETTTYSVTVTGNGCTATDEVTVNR
ncbi:MAG: hypothetical protein AAF570_04455 [Bacteroidota bacterium]